MRAMVSLLFLGGVLGGCDSKGQLVDPASVDADGDGANQLEDCDDDNAALHPGATENCDGLDNNCDGEVDEGLLVSWFRDQDGDGFGNSEERLEECSPPGGYVTVEGDCDDADVDVHPQAQEICDGLDNNCSGEVDDLDGLEAENWYLDSDNDGYGDANDVMSACAQPSGRVATGDDCDDSDPEVNPGVAETWYDGVDSDCDGADDMDRDSDGYAGGATGDDCDDGNSGVYPSAPESCDGIDSACDGGDEVLLEEDFDGALDSAFVSLNGTATQVYDGPDGSLQLTAASNGQRGTMFFLPTASGYQFEASFVVEIGEGSGADGLTFGFLSETDPTVMGTSGGGLSLQGLEGFGLEFDSYYNGDRLDISGEHVALVDAVDLNPHQQTSAAFRNAGDVLVEMEMTGGSYEVWLDGSSVLAGQLTNYSLGEAMFGFTAATGGLNDAHRVDDVSICSF